MRRAATILAIAALVAAPAAVFAAEPFVANLSTDAETPAPTLPSDYAGTGEASAEISDDATEITFEVTFSGLTGPLTMAHIHWGEEGAAGPPIFWLTDQSSSDTPSPLSGTLTEADFMPADGGPQTFAEALDAIRGGSTYVNLHTEQNAPGEIRGQLRELPDTAAVPESAPAVDSTALLLLTLVGLSTFIVAMRRFAFTRG